MLQPSTGNVLVCHKTEVFTVPVLQEYCENYNIN
jgi:hypothetical protein